MFLFSIRFRQCIIGEVFLSKINRFFCFCSDLISQYFLVAANALKENIIWETLTIQQSATLALKMHDVWEEQNFFVARLLEILKSQR